MSLDYTEGKKQVKFKYYLRGCGFGILFTALVLTISFHTRGGVMTDEKAMLRASELGMVMPDSTEGLSDTQEDTQAAKPVVKEDTQNQKPESSEKNSQDSENNKEKDKKKDKSTEDEKSKDSQKSSEKDSEDNKDKKKDKAEVETVTITIRRGEVCRELAEDLYGKGLVDDAEKFRKYMQDSGYDSNICVGTFQLKKGMTYAQIAKALVTKPE